MIFLEGDEPRLNDKFSHPNMYYVGSHTGCGCGFLKDGVVGKELEETQADYHALADILSKVLVFGAHVELYVCWEGDQGLPAIDSIEITLDDLVRPGFEFQERVNYQLCNHRS